MRWFFQLAVVGFLTLAGAFTLYGQGTAGTAATGQGTAATGQGAAGAGQGTAGTQDAATAHGTAGAQQGGVNAQGSGDISGQGVDARGGTQARANGNNRGGDHFPDDNEPWFSNINLRDELGLDDDQIERLRETYNQTRSELQGRNSADQLSDEARAERMRQMRNQFDDQFSQRSADIFRNENQRNRFNQLGLQRRGYSAFDNPQLQHRLNLNETQLRQLRDVNNSWNSELETLRGSYAGDRTGTEQRFNQLQDRTRTNFEGILNDQQRTAYDEMTGNRFDFGASSYLEGNLDHQRSVAAGRNGTSIGTALNPGGGTSIGTAQNPGGGTSIGTAQNPGGGTGGTGTGTSGAGTGASGTSGGTGTGAGGGTGGAGSSGSGSGASGS